MAAGEHKPERHLRLVPRVALPHGTGQLARLTSRPAAALARLVRFARAHPAPAVAVGIALGWAVSRVLSRRGP